jgi:3-oxoacyl-[acyl-carrier protein] reductase
MKNVLITGGSRGIGKAMVQAFVESGYNVAFTYKNSADAARKLSSETGALAIMADSAVEKDIISATSIAAEAFGGIDILINNAGISSFSLLQDLSLAEWNNCLATNLTSAFLYSREVIPYMLRSHKGRIINVSSMWGLVGASCEVHYSAAKAGLIGFTKALAKELGPSGITVNAIAPGVIETDMNAHLSPDDLRALSDETPMGRIGKADEIAKAALYLAGEDASFITGDVLNISGGLVI